MAILAGIAIAHKYVFARQGAGLLGNPAVFEQPDDAGKGDGAVKRVDVAGNMLFGRGETLKDENHGAPGSADVDRLIAGVKDQNGLM